MRSFWLSLIIVNFCVVASSQDICSVQVVDSLTKTPISDVSLSSENGFYLGKTNSKGYIELDFTKYKVLIFDHVSYDQKTVLISNNRHYYKIELAPSTVLISAVNIMADEPKVVFRDNTYHAADYEFIDQNHLLILTYEKKRMFKRPEHSEIDILERCKLVCLDQDLKIKTESKIIDEAVEITTDAYAQCFLRTVSDYYFILVNEHGISLEKMPEDFSISSHKGIILDKESKIQLLSNHDSTFPEFSYFIYNEDLEVELVCTIQDKDLMHLFRAQYRNFQPREKLEAYRMELKTGIDKEVISGYMAGFHNSMFFNPIYAPAFKLDTGFVVFNHLEHKAEIYSNDGLLKDSIFINYHLKGTKNGWGNQLIQDSASGDIYTYFQSGGIAKIKKINLENGLLENDLKLSCKYPEQINVHNGEVYYLYRPFGSSQKKYLYKEGEPFSDLPKN